MTSMYYKSKKQIKDTILKQINQKEKTLFGSKESIESAEYKLGIAYSKLKRFWIRRHIAIYVSPNRWNTGWESPQEIKKKDVIEFRKSLNLAISKLQDERERFHQNLMNQMSKDML